MLDEDIEIAAILPQMRAATARQGLAAIAAAAAKTTGIHERLIQPALVAQEAPESSGIGDGVALAHLKLRGLAGPQLLFARLMRPVDFNAVDARPVDLLLLLLSPEADGPLHLRRLARLTRMMREETLRRHLRGTDDADTLRALLADPQSRLLAA